MTDGLEYMSELSRTTVLTFTAQPVSPIKNIVLQIGANTLTMPVNVYVTCMRAFTTLFSGINSCVFCVLLEGGASNIQLCLFAEGRCAWLHITGPGVDIPSFRKTTENLLTHWVPYETPSSNILDRL